MSNFRWTRPYQQQINGIAVRSNHIKTNDKLGTVSFHPENSRFLTVYTCRYNYKTRPRSVTQFVDPSTSPIGWHKVQRASKRYNIVDFEFTNQERYDQRGDLLANPTSGNFIYFWVALDLMWTDRTRRMGLWKLHQRASPTKSLETSLKLTK